MHTWQNFTYTAKCCLNLLKKVFLSFFYIYIKLRMFVCVLVTQLYLILHDSMNCSSSKLLSPWNFPGKNTGLGCHSLFQEIFMTQGSNLGLLHWRQIIFHLSHQGRLKNVCAFSCFSHVQLCVTQWTVVCQVPLSIGFSRQEYWSGLPGPLSGDLPDSEHLLHCQWVLCH